MKKDNILMMFDGTVAENMDTDDLDTILHDDYLLPTGCKSYDEWTECDTYELLGKD